MKNIIFAIILVCFLGLYAGCADSTGDATKEFSSKMLDRFNGLNDGDTWCYLYDFPNGPASEPFLIQVKKKTGSKGILGEPTRYYFVAEHTIGLSETNITVEVGDVGALDFTNKINH